MKQSLGLLEVSGLALAISCADVMAKAASITLLGMEKTNGSGWTVIKVTGDVASVQSAIITGAHFAQARDGLVAQKVIARPADGIMALSPEPVIVHRAAVEPATEIKDTVVLQETAAEEVVETTSSAAETSLVTCNLCLDPLCPRQKGEPRTLCIHSGQRGE
ncbi:BMC domain-containing protein [Phytobacter sp. V91]|uniref:BMC domain-containing protein n=1 Tax=Phytobacter sp. V91 TaxID=3369425 RepID=UPI003F6345EB